MNDFGEMWFNELSIILQPDIYAANRVIVGFIDALAAARKAGCSNRLRLAQDLYRIEVASNYKMGNWASSTADVNRRILLRTWNANWPHLSDDEAEMKARSLGYDFTVSGTRSIGIGLAWLFEGIPISFHVSPFLDEKVELQIQSLVDDAPEDGLEEIKDGARVETTIEFMNHISNAAHVEKVVAAARTNRLAIIKDGNELWENRLVLFSNLALCASVAGCVTSLGPGDAHFVAVRKALQALDVFASRWTSGPFPLDNVPGKITAESELTLERYGIQRTFEVPGGSTRRFSLHGRLTPNAWRYYVLEEKIGGKLVIGYIGPKLPTINDPT